MKIGVTTFGCDLKSGMAPYIINLAKKFALIADGDEFEMLAHRTASREYLADVNSGSISPYDVAEWLANPVLNIAWHQVSLPGVCRKRDYDALFIPAASRRTPLWAPCPVIGTVHDVSPFHVSDKYDPARTFYQTRVLPRFIKRLTHVIAISESTKRDLQDYVGIPEDRITVIHQGTDLDTFYPREREAVEETLVRYGIRTPYILYVSRIESPAKNHIRLIRAFERLKERESIPHQLVLAGADWHGAEEVHAAAKESRYRNDILLTGYVHESDLPEVYCGAEMLVFPSVFEGFGLPILQAMASGVPVACSNISAMPEVAGEAGVLFDPMEIDSIVEGMQEIISSEERRVTLVRKGLDRAAELDCETTARKTLELIHRVAGK